MKKDKCKNQIILEALILIFSLHSDAKGFGYNVASAEIQSRQFVKLTEWYYKLCYE